MSHWVNKICRCAGLQPNSAERHEQAHKTNLMDCYNASNHNLNYLLQVITFQRSILCCKMTELNLQALAQRRENIAAASKVLLSGADLAYPLGSQSYAKAEFMGPQNCCDGRHADAIIKDFRALLDNTQDPTHRVAISGGTREFIKYTSRYKMYISDEQMHAMDLCIDHGIEVQVEGLDGERISQMCWCTGSQSWRGGDQQNNWVWVKQRPGRCNGAPNGRLTLQLQRLFKIQLLSEDGAFIEYLLPLALTTIPENSGNLDPVLKFIHVRSSLAAKPLQVFSVGNIVSCAHVIPEIATTSKTGDGLNERWIGNRHINLATWNDVYN